MTPPTPATAASRHVLSRMHPLTARGMKWVGIEFQTEQDWKEALVAIEAEARAEAEGLLRTLVEAQNPGSTYYRDEWQEATTAAETFLKEKA